MFKIDIANRLRPAIIPVRQPFHYSPFEEEFGRIASILEQVRGNVVRAVNTNMVLAYWLIGREIVQELQQGQGRAEYGKQIIEDLSARLKSCFGRGFSTTNLRYFRTFYTVYTDRLPEIRQIGSGVLDDLDQAVEAAYVLYLPTEEELRLEIERERRLIETALTREEKP